MTLKECPLCHGSLFPHCSPRNEREMSRTCDLATCVRCGESGRLDGRWWSRTGPVPYGQEGE